MKLKFLGTAAAEGFPALFCNCKYCSEARRLGGKNIRTRSQALVNDDLLIDFPADTYHHFLMNGIEGDKIENLIVTHSHMDHCYPDDLEMRHPPYAHDMYFPTIGVYAAQGAYNKLTAKPRKNVNYNLLIPYETVKIGRYEVTPLPARHADGDGAVFYIIKGDSTLLYAHDTGYFFEEVFDFIEKSGYVFDAVTLDCTFVDLDDNYPNHMGIRNNRRVFERLAKIGAVTDKTVKIINHFSHNGNPRHDRVEALVEGEGILVSFDGMEVQF